MPSEVALPLITAALLAALLASKLLARYLPLPENGRLVPLDGLRGYLATFVFLHHAAIWQGYSVTGAWMRPPSALQVHLGESSVVMFFMITAFLFYSRLLDSKEIGVDWLKLYTGRILRLCPLYFFAILTVLLVVFVHEGASWKSDCATTMRALAKWLVFTAFGAPDLNGVENTRLILAGVTWSLAYEWAFYFSLPLFAVIVRVRGTRLATLLTLITVVWSMQTAPEFRRLIPFASGIAAAHVIGIPACRQFLGGRAASWLVLAAIALVPLLFSRGHDLGSLILLSFVFCAIVAGNCLFGLLSFEPARRLGEISYSIYLLHGLVLYGAYRVGPAALLVKEMPAAGHWVVAVFCAPLVVLLSTITFRLIEQPAMALAPRTYAWLGRPFRLSNAPR